MPKNLNPKPQWPRGEFAKDIDNLCHSCKLAGEFVDNGNMLDLIELRKECFPEETRHLDALASACKNCFESGKPSTDTLEARFSCSYRLGPEFFEK